MRVLWSFSLKSCDWTRLRLARTVLEQLLEELGGDVLVFEAADLGEEMIGQDAEVGLL